MKGKTNQKTILDKAIVASLIVINAIFLIYWCILSFYSRFHYDDLHFLWKMREMSIFEYVKEMYYTRSGRFVGYGCNGVMSVITNALGFHQLWAILFYAIGIGVCWLVIKDELKQISRIGLFLGLCLVYNLYILTNIDFPVFTWLCAMTYYLQMPLALLLLKLLNRETMSRKHWLVLGLLVFNFGGGSEMFTPMVLLAMFVYGIYYWHSKDWNVHETWAIPQIKRIVWSAVVLLTLWGVVVAAPGNYARMEADEFVHPSGVLGWCKAMASALGMFFYYMAFYVPYYLVAFALAFYAGTKRHEPLSISKRKVALWLLLGFMTYLFISSIPTVYLYNGFGIQRTYTPVVLLLLLLFVGLGYVFGVARHSELSGWCSVVGMLALIVVMCLNVVQDSPTAKAYGTAVDERMAYLCALRDDGQKETVTVEPLPIPYTEDVKHFVLSRFGKDSPMTLLYYISDTEQNPNEYVFHVKRLYDLDFDFVLPQSENE